MVEKGFFLFYLLIEEREDKVKAREHDRRTKVF